MSKFLISGWIKTKWLGRFIKKYIDIFVVLPITFILFFNSYWLIRIIDPTAAVLDIGNISILLFNFLITVVLFCTSYFFYASYFSDIFKNGWEKSIKNPVIAYLISAGLWISTLIVCYFTLTRNL